MRELSVYYCPKCGRYGYYQLIRNTVCHNCDVKMIRLNISYQNFMDLGLAERDALIIRKLLTPHKSITERLIHADRSNNYRAAIAALSHQIQKLETDNQELNNTVTWMHQLIWDLLDKNKTLEHQLADQTSAAPKVN